MKVDHKEIQGIGKRENQEDYFTTANNLFIVCDGVGGNNKGEVASKLCAKNLIKLSDSDFLINEVTFQDSLMSLELEFDNYVINNPQSYGMATTLTLLQLKDKRAFVGHVGDSRIYHVRNGKILFETKDHSFVNDLVEAGLINNEEAKNHPQKNVITEAIQGGGKPTRASLAVLENIEVSDYFMLCSDGVLECIDEAFISREFKLENSVDEIGKKIEDNCNKFSKDNFTAVIIKIANS